MEITRTARRTLTLALAAALLTACGPSQLEQELTAKNKSLQKERDSLHQEATVLKTSLQSALDDANRQVAALTEERDNHSSTVLLLTGERHQLAQEVVNLRERLAATEAAKSRVGARLADVQQERDLIAGEFETLLAAKSQVGARLAHVQQDRDWLEMRYDNLYAAKSQVGARLAQMQISSDASDSRLNQLQAARSSVGARLADLTLQRDVREQEYAETLAALAADTAAVSAARDVAISQWQALQDQLLAANHSRQTLDGQLAEAIAARDAAVASLSEARNQLAAANSANQNMAMLLDTVTQVQKLEQANAGLVAEIQRLQEDKGALENQFQSFVAEVRNAQTAQNQTLQTQIDHLATQVSKAQAVSVETTLPATVPGEVAVPAQ